MTGNQYGIVFVDDPFDTAVIRFIRTFPQSPRKVWRHLIDNASLPEWLTSEPGGFIQHVAGGEVYLPTSTSGDIEGEVVEFVPGETLGMTWTTEMWDGGVVLWMIDPAERGTVLTFEHADEPNLGLEHYARTLATWHQTLDLFDASLVGRPHPRDVDAWSHLYLHYLDSLAQSMGRSASTVGNRPPGESPDLA